MLYTSYVKDATKNLTLYAKITYAENSVFD